MQNPKKTLLIAHFLFKKVPTKTKQTREQFLFHLFLFKKNSEKKRIWHCQVLPKTIESFKSTGGSKKTIWGPN